MGRWVGLMGCNILGVAKARWACSFCRKASRPYMGCCGNFYHRSILHGNIFRHASAYTFAHTSYYCGHCFFTKAGILSGEFYPPAIALYLTTIPMSLWPEYCQLIFGTVSALCFFIPGLKYHKLRLRSRLASSRGDASGGSSQNNLVTTQSAR